MAQTKIKTEQVGEQQVTRPDLNTSTPNKAVVTKIIAGTNVTISSTGADPGTGDVTISGT